MARRIFCSDCCVAVDFIFTITLPTYRLSIPILRFQKIHSKNMYSCILRRLLIKVNAINCSFSSPMRKEKAVKCVCFHALLSIFSITCIKCFLPPAHTYLDICLCFPKFSVSSYTKRIQFVAQMRNFSSP